MRRALVAVLAAQTAVLGVVAVPRLLVRLTGTEYRLRVRPVDPIDPFRGAYADLIYDGFDAPRDDGRVYVALRRDGDAWTGGAVTRERPERGPYVACDSDGDRVRCGIESWFASQRAAVRAERDLADGGVAVVRVDGSGRAVLVRLEP